MFLRYLQYLLTDFRQTFVTGAPWDTDDLITFLGQKVKVQGHTIAAEAHSTRWYRRVQVFIVGIAPGSASELLNIVGAGLFRDQVPFIPPNRQHQCVEGGPGISREIL